ncbi:MAG: ATP-binding protein [Gammaproteobacteria bacterium]
MRGANYNDPDQAYSADDRRVKLLHQVRILYELLPTTQWIHLAAILVVFGLLLGHVDTSLLSSWVGLVLLILLFRIFITKYYKKSVKTLDNAEYWFNWFLVGTILYGVMWSTTAILLIPAEDPRITGFTALILAGLAAGGVPVSSVSIKVFIVYAVSTMLPYASFLISSGQNPQSPIGILLFIFCLLIFMVAYQVNKFFTSLIDLQLRTDVLEQEIKRESEKRQFAENALLDNTLEEGLADKIRQRSRIIRDKQDLSLTDKNNALLARDAEEMSAHELKLLQYVELLYETLLRNIKSAAILLNDVLDSTLNEAQKKNVKIVEKILHDAKYSIEKSFSDLQPYNTAMVNIVTDDKKEKINIRRLLIYLTHEIPLLYKAKYITIKRKIDKRIPQEVFGNRAALEQIIYQILTNAFMYSDGGTINIVVDRIGEDSDHLALRFRIADTGAGMSREMVDHLRTGAVLEEPVLGLDIIKYLVAKLGGELTAESTPGVGSTVEVKLSLMKHGEAARKSDAVLTRS